MGITGHVYSRPAKFSTIIADADLDIGARAILTTNISLYEYTSDFFGVRNRLKTAYKDLAIKTLSAGDNISCGNIITADILNERNSGSGVTIDGLLIKDDKIQEANGIGGNVWQKKASANVMNSHDAEIHDERAAGGTWLLQKTFTLTYGIRGTLRFTLQAKGENVSVANKVIWAKNSKASDLGVEFVPANVNYQADSQDVNVGTMAAGETIEIWTQTNNWMGIFVKECRISYDEDNDSILSAMVTS